MTAVTEHVVQGGTLAIRPLQPTIGAEISGVDLTRPLSDAERERIGAELAEFRLHEPDLSRDMGAWLATTLASDPWPHVMGPLLDRGAPNGVVWVGGREVGRWGDPGRREMSFSIAKSALGTVAGLAFDDDLARVG